MIPNLSNSAHVLLLWLVARKAGLVPNISASHADALNSIPDLGAVIDELQDRKLATRDHPNGASYSPTPWGEEFVRTGGIDV